MRRLERGGVLRGMTMLALVLGLLGLTGLVAYLYSDINHRRYRLTAESNLLKIEQGLFFPAGFGPYIPATPALRDIYAPLPIPEAVSLHGPGFLGTSETFDERTDLDRALFTLLSGWARQRIDSTDMAQLDLATQYVRRSEALPAISEEQRSALRELRANLAYQTGFRAMQGIVASLQHAQEQFRLAIGLGSPHAAEAQHWIETIDQRIALYRNLPPAPPASEGNKQ